MRRTEQTPIDATVGDTITLVLDLAASADLPCPWCDAATSESDPRCPSCGRRFG